MKANAHFAIEETKHYLCFAIRSRLDLLHTAHLLLKAGPCLCSCCIGESTHEREGATQERTRSLFVFDLHHQDFFVSTRFAKTIIFTKSISDAKYIAIVLVALYIQHTELLLFSTQRKRLPARQYCNRPTERPWTHLHHLHDPPVHHCHQPIAPRLTEQESGRTRAMLGRPPKIISFCHTALLASIGTSSLRNTFLRRLPMPVESAMSDSSQDATLTHGMAKPTWNG